VNIQHLTAYTVCVLRMPDNDLKTLNTY